MCVQPHKSSLITLQLDTLQFSMGASIRDSSPMLPARVTDALDNTPAALQILGTTISALGDVSQEYDM